jgi:hypothetical protein
MGESGASTLSIRPECILLSGWALPIATEGPNSVLLLLSTEGIYGLAHHVNSGRSPPGPRGGRPLRGPILLRKNRSKYPGQAHHASQIFDLEESLFVSIQVEY